MSRKSLTPLGLLARSTNPASGSIGDTYYNTTDNKVYTYNGSAWAAVSGSGGSGTYTYSATAPSSPTAGDRWLDSDTGIAYTYVNDGSVPAWIELSASGFIGTQGDTGAQGTTGLQGTDGAQGTQGLQGTFGPSNSPIQAVSTYTLIASDAGKTVSTSTGGVTVPASVFAAGDNLILFNNSGSSQTITQGASVTLRLAGTASTGNRTLSQYGVATLLCITGGATPVFVIAGTGLS